MRLLGKCPQNFFQQSLVKLPPCRTLSIQKNVNNNLTTTPMIYKKTEIENALNKLQKISEDGEVDLCLNDDSGIGVVTLKNIKQKNAMTAKMMVDLRKIGMELRCWKNGKALIVKGDSNEFCSGLDLKVARSFKTPEDGAEMCMFMQEVLSTFQFLPFITVSAVSGNAIGGGAELMLATDFRLAFANTKIKFVQKLIGTIPGWGGVTRLNNIIGYRKSLDLLASAKTLNMDSAFELGLVDYKIGNTNSSKCTKQLTLEWLENHFSLSKTPAYVFQALKTATRNVHYGTENNTLLIEKLRIEKEIFQTVWGGPANKAALSNIKHGKAK